ncbi:hypothetical protein Peur_006775 [Populus x canadensis]
MWQSTGKSMQEAFQDLNALLAAAALCSVVFKSTEQGNGFQRRHARVAVECWYHIPSNQRVCWCHVSSTTVPSDFIRIPLEKAGGMINLIDIYCLLSRAPGTAMPFGQSINANSL